MSGRSWLRSVSMMLGLVVGILLTAPAAYSKKHNATPRPTPTATPTPTPEPTPEAKVWNFDSDTAHQEAKDWKASDGEWQVLADPTAPSQPNTYGLPPATWMGRELKSVTAGLNYFPMTLLTDPTEYGDFSYEAQFKGKKGYFDCSGGLVFRYADEKDYYVLAAQCPSDIVALYRVTGGTAELLKQAVTPIDEGTWYSIKVTAQGPNFSCFLNGKDLFEISDSKIAKGRLGLWSKDDSEPRFDDVKLTLPLAGAGAEATPASSGGELPSIPSGPGAGPGASTPAPLPALH